MSGLRKCRTLTGPPHAPTQRSGRRQNRKPDHTVCRLPFETPSAVRLNFTVVPSHLYGLESTQVCVRACSLFFVPTLLARVSNAGECVFNGNSTASSNPFLSASQSASLHSLRYAVHKSGISRRNRRFPNLKPDYRESGLLYISPINSIFLRGVCRESGFEQNCHQQYGSVRAPRSGPGRRFKPTCPDQSLALARRVCDSADPPELTERPPSRDPARCGAVKVGRGGEA